LASSFSLETAGSGFCRIEETTTMTCRPIPNPIMQMLKQQFPNLLLGDIDGDDVFLLMAKKNGQPQHYCTRYLASPNFKTAVRVADSGFDNLLMLCEKDGFRLDLLVPEE
jgi:hypothetical protein